MRLFRRISPARFAIHIMEVAVIFKFFKQCRRQSTLGLAVATLLSALIVGGAPAPASASITYNELISGNSLPNAPMCLDDYAYNSDDGAPVVQWSCLNGLNQNWILQPTGDGYFNIISALNGKCLDVYNYNQANNADIVIWHCIPLAVNQEWEKGLGSDGRFILRARHSNKCLDVLAYNHNIGGRVTQWDCLYGINQLWLLG